MPKLPKAPLQEAIFEIRWELDLDSSSNQQFDIGFSLAQGKLQEIVKKEFPAFARKVPYQFPEQALQYQVINQYWNKPTVWPVLQLGPGIFTVNETELNYDWAKTYFPLIDRALDWVHEAYGGNLRINYASLRYIDSVKPKDYGFDGKWQEFIQQHFNFAFVNNFNSRGLIKGIQFDQYFELEDKSELHISLNSGKYRKTEEEALIWQTAVLKSGKFEKDSLIRWLKDAHSITSDLFKEMTKPQFYDSFK
jgi:uncharacterized protein (TIGR04255 family)